MQSADYILTIHDELISNLILLNRNHIVYNDGLPSKVATIQGKRANISLVVGLSNKYSDLIRRKKDNKGVGKKEYGDFLQNNYSLTSQEIVVYLILLHHYIVSNQENAIITVKQINKYYRQIKTINDYLYDSYIKAIQGLNTKRVAYYIKKKYVNNHKLTGFKDSHKLLNIVNGTKLKNDFRFEYNLGSLGKIIRDSKNYSTIIPKGIYSCKYANINYLLIFLYLSRMIYINRNQRKAKQPIKRITLQKLFENICKYNKQGINMGITYADVFYNDIKNAKKLKFNNQFYESYADDYRLTNSRKELYYLKRIKSNRQQIDKCINKNRDFKMLMKNLKSALTILKSTHQIFDFNIIIPSRIKDVGPEGIDANWNELTVNNFDMAMIELIFLPCDTQSMKMEMQRIENYEKTLENKRKRNANIEREENKNERKN